MQSNSSKKKKEDKIGNNFSLVLGINENLIKSHFFLKFKDDNIEKEFQILLIKDNKKFKIWINIFMIFYFIYRFFMDSINEDYLSFSLNLSFFLLSSIFFALFWFSKNFNKKSVFSFVISMILLIIMSFTAISESIKEVSISNNLIIYDSHLEIDGHIENLINKFLNSNFSINEKIENSLFLNISNFNSSLNRTNIKPYNFIDYIPYNSREFYILIIFNILEILSSYEINLICAIIFNIITNFTGIYLLVNQFEKNKRIVFDLLINLFSGVCSIILKRKLSLKIRENFIKNYKFKRYYIYCNDLINNMNGYQFTLKDKEILIYNQNFKKTVNECYKDQKKNKKIDDTFNSSKNIILEHKYDGKNYIQNAECDSPTTINSASKKLLNTDVRGNLAGKNKFSNFLENFKEKKLEIFSDKIQIDKDEKQIVNEEEFGKKKTKNNKIKENFTFKLKNFNTFISKNDSYKKQKKKDLKNMKNYLENIVPIKLENDFIEYNLENLLEISKKIEKEFRIKKTFKNNSFLTPENIPLGKSDIELNKKGPVMNESKNENENKIQVTEKNRRKGSRVFDFTYLKNFTEKDENPKINNYEKIRICDNSSLINNNLLKNIIDRDSDKNFDKLKIIKINSNLKNHDQGDCSLQTQNKNKFDDNGKAKTDYFSSTFYLKDTDNNIDDQEIGIKMQDNKFLYLGEFSRKEDGKYFEVYFRKLTLYENVVDFLMYDMTHIKEAEKLEINVKTKYFAKIAHEFKTPVNSVIGLIKQINCFLDNKDKSSLDETKNILNQIENLSNYVIFLINDMIEYSNIKDNNCAKDNKDENVSKINLKIEKINLKEIAEFSKDITETLILSKGKERSVKIINDFESGLEKLNLFSDEFRLKQILLNFISNSVKFTKSGYIKIKSEIYIPDNQELSEKNINKVKISIIDSGLGIKKTDLETLLKFQDNTMLKAGNNLNQGGSGLGLSITKYLAEKLNHDIEVTSEYGKGSQFAVIIKYNNHQEILNEEKGNLVSKKENIKGTYLNFAKRLKKSNLFKSIDSKGSLKDINSLHTKKTIQDLMIKKTLERFKNGLKNKVIYLNESYANTNHNNQTHDNQENNNYREYPLISNKNNSSFITSNQNDMNNNLINMNNQYFQNNHLENNSSFNLSKNRHQNIISYNNVNAEDTFRDKSENPSSNNISAYNNLIKTNPIQTYNNSPFIDFFSFNHKNNKENSPYKEPQLFIDKTHSIKSKSTMKKASSDSNNIHLANPSKNTSSMHKNTTSFKVFQNKLGTRIFEEPNETFGDSEREREKKLILDKGENKNKNEKFPNLENMKGNNLTKETKISTILKINSLDNLNFQENNLGNIKEKLKRNNGENFNRFSKSTINCKISRNYRSKEKNLNRIINNQNPKSIKRENTFNNNFKNQFSHNRKNDVSIFKLNNNYYNTSDNENIFTTNECIQNHIFSSRRSCNSGDITKRVDEMNFNIINSDLKMNLLNVKKIEKVNNNESFSYLICSPSANLSNNTIYKDKEKISSQKKKSSNILNNIIQNEIKNSTNNNFYENNSYNLSSRTNIGNVNQVNINNINVNNENFENILKKFSNYFDLNNGNNYNNSNNNMNTASNIFLTKIGNGINFTDGFKNQSINSYKWDIKLLSMMNSIDSNNNFSNNINQENNTVSNLNNKNINFKTTDEIKKKFLQSNKSVNHYLNNKNIDVIDPNLLNLNDNNLNSNKETTQQFPLVDNHAQNKIFSPTNLNLKLDVKEIAERENIPINHIELENFSIIKYKILIVDDHKFLRDSLKNLINKLLEKRNLLKFFEVIEGVDGVDILYQIINDQAQNNLIRCIITDENMEYINGSEAIKIIKDLENKNRIKPVAIASITSFEDDFMKKAIGAVGVDCFLPKPCSDKHLLSFFEDYKIFYCEDDI